jgi:tagatose 1,6-diphosphate aldolase GatY/KbaY
MPFVSTKEMLSKAMNNDFAIGAYNAHFLDMIPFYIDIAEEEGAPLIIQTSMGTVDFVGMENIVRVTRERARSSPVPVALHLDHCEDFGQILKAIRAGYTSVMIDGSKCSFEDNVELTKKVVDIAHYVGVTVEAELGYVGGRRYEGGTEDLGFTDPDQALDFVEKTKVDLLAIAIGTVHGFYKGEPNIDFDRLELIRQKVSVPLVLHGGSGLSDDIISRVISGGIAKINVATELKYPWAQGIRNLLKKDRDEFDPRIILEAGRTGLREAIKLNMKRFNTRSYNE